LRDIAKELQITRHLARKVLLAHNVGLRRSNRGLKGADSKTAGRYIGTAPYGYFIQLGKLVEDNREQQTIQLIMKLRSMGKSQAAIARYLNDHKMRTRRSKKWDHSTIGNILKYQAFIRNKLK
jgi:DNA invertase Pin-like site-specific DNA recombinase